ncbi:unnamed protein product [Nezara viridula]|uniref:Uncharacterized protein n=1 Tax=Nezara viridula TaxID=85310 RepID=A0A9P0E2L5_NEZVI|nr:unnamed protein product [Nezara viridula]
MDRRRYRFLDENFGTNENDLRLLWEAVHKSRMETSYQSAYCVKSITTNKITPRSLKEKIKENTKDKEEKVNE